MPSEYTLTLEEVSKRLNKSKKTISRYIKKGLLSPIEEQSDKNTLTYKFKETDIEAFKSGQRRQDKNLRQDKTGQKQNKGRVNSLHSAKTRQDNDRTNEDIIKTDRLVSILEKQLDAQNAQIGKMQETINQLTVTANQNSETLKLYSVQLLALTNGKTGQNITEGQAVEQTIIDETDQTFKEEEVEADKVEVKPVKEKEEKTDRTKEVRQDKEEETKKEEKTGQNIKEEVKKKGLIARFFDFIIEGQ